MMPNLAEPGPLPLQPLTRCETWALVIGNPPKKQLHGKCVYLYHPPISPIRACMLLIN